MASRRAFIFVALYVLLLPAGMTFAQSPVAQEMFASNRGNSWLDVAFPTDSPVLIVSSGLGSTTAHLRGASIALEIHTSLLLRNTGTKSISGLALRVEAQDLTPMAKGSVAVPSLDVQPGDVFPVRIDMELVRPFNVQRSQSPLVKVSLDCALFDDLTAYGPDKLGSKRALMVYELEARRDRRYLANLLSAGQIAELRKELDFGLEGYNLPQLAMELWRGALGSAIAKQEPESVGILAYASSPVEAVSGEARLLRNEVGGPVVEIRNLSKRPVVSVEMGWIVRDDRGRDFMAGSMPRKVSLAPVESGKMSQSGAMRFLQQSGQPLAVEKLIAFVNSVEFSDGSIWIPSRGDISKATDSPTLRRELAMSPEQERLQSLYRKKGMDAIAADLKRVH